MRQSLWLPPEPEDPTSCQGLCDVSCRRTTFLSRSHVLLWHSLCTALLLLLLLSFIDKYWLYCCANAWYMQRNEKTCTYIYIYVYMQTCTRLQDSSWKEGATPFSIFHVTFWSNTPLWVNNFPLKKQLLLQGILNDLAWIWPYLLADEPGFCTWHTLYMFIFENATLWIGDLVQWSHRSNQIHRSTRKSRLVLL